MRVRRQYTTAVATLLLAGLAGCTPSPASSPAPTAPTAAPIPTPAPTTSAAPAGAAVERLRAVLLTPADAGAAYVEDDAPAVDADAPCGGEPVALAHPQAVRVGVALRHVDLEVREGVAVYRDAASAAAALDATTAGLACGTGTVDGRPARFSPPQDLTDHVDADRATGWQVALADRDVLVVAVQAGAAVLTFHFAAPTGTGLADRPDALGLTRTAVDRLVTA